MDIMEYLFGNFEDDEIIKFYNVWCRESYNDDIFYSTYNLLNEDTLKILRDMGEDIKIKEYYLFDGDGGKIYFTKEDVIDEINRYYSDDIIYSFDNGDTSIIIALSSIGTSIEDVRGAIFENIDIYDLYKLLKLDIGTIYDKSDLYDMWVDTL